jgi:potassium efflux system protein
MFQAFRRFRATLPHIPALLLVCASLSAADAVNAAAAVTAAGADAVVATPTLEAMERQLEAYRAGKADDPQNARLIEIYLDNVQNLHTVADNRENQARYERLFQESPAKVARYTAELNDLQRQTRSAKGLAQGVAVERLERLLRETRARLAELRTRETSLNGTANSLQGRIESARKELNATQAATEPADKAPVSVAGESGAMTQARMDQWLVDRELRASRIARLETEAHTIPERLAAVQAELKLVTAQREQAEKFLSELLGMDNLKRIGEAEKQRDAVREQLAAPGSTHPAIVALREEIATLADEYVTVVARSESVGADVASAAAQLAEVSAAYDSIRQQLEIAALSDALGPVLMEQYAKLGSYEQPERNLSATAELLSRTRLREFQVGRMLSAEVQSRESVYRALEADTGLPAADRAAAVAEADRLLSSRNQVLEALNRTYMVSTGQIVDLEQAYREQSEVAAKFRELVDRNLIWMKSHPRLGPGDVIAWPRSTRALLAAQDWSAFGSQLRTHALSHPASALLALLVLVLVSRYRKPLAQRLEAISLRSVGWRDYRYRMGFMALGIHLLVALPVPLLLLWAGWLFAQMDGSIPLARALTDASYQTAGLSYLYLVIIQAMGPDGFARGHLRWKTARVLSVQRLLRTGLWVMLPLAFVSATLALLAAGSPASQSYRVTGLLMTAVFFVFLVLILRAGRGMFDSAFYSRSYPLLARVGLALLFVIVAAQPLVVLLDVQGYHFTARELQIRVFLSSVVLVLAKMMLDAGVLGLTIAAQRSLAAAQAAAAQEEPAIVTDTAAQARVVPDVFEGIDLEKMNASAVALLQVVVAGAAVLVMVVIWRQFFTALSILDTVTLWSYADTVDGKETVSTVSAFDAGGALLVLVLSLVLASGVPSLIGIVFYRFITEKGVLYAIQTVIRYVVAVLAVMVSLQLLGFGWSKLQWMAAGLSVGLGFGLQAIFANFFSGLIMLFERPVRIGDVITLGEFSGTIHRIRMRATTITDFDNREIIVPNQMFVTERLINWTLTSSVVRLSFDVGISYDADPRLAREMLLEILAADPRVLHEPPPNVIFREFGASSLNLRCYAHVEDVAVRMQVQNDLHLRINEVFRERGIEIAYPQLDLHLRSVEAGATLAPIAPCAGPAGSGAIE